MARKPKVVKENSERWLLTYSDLITLLLVFFILLYAMSSTDARKFNDLTGALRQAFNNGSFQLIQVGGSPGKTQKIAGIIPSKGTLVKQLREEMLKLSKELGLSANVIQVGQSREGIVLTLAGNLLFYPGGADLKPDSYVLLGRIAGLVRTLPNRLRVEGNTDNQPSADPAYASSWELSSRRADAIAEYLGGPGGIAPARLAAEGLGQYHPVASNRTAEGRARNRRADIVILYPQ